MELLIVVAIMAMLAGLLLYVGDNADSLLPNMDRQDTPLGQT